MANPATIRISGDVSDASGLDHIDVNFTTAAVALSHQIVTFGNGNTTFVPPTGATGCLIVPPAGNATLFVLRGNSGDTGIPLSKTQPTFLALDSTATVVIIFVLTGSVAGATVIFV